MDSVQNILNRHTRDSAEVQALNWLAQEAEKSDGPLAKRYYREAIRISETYTEVPSVVSSYVKMALLLSRAAQNDSAQVYIDKASRVLEHYPKRYRMRLSYYNACGLINKNLGNHEEALKYYNNISALGEPALSKSDVAGNYLNIANIYHLTGKSALSQAYHFKALKIFESLNNETGMAFCYNGLGILFYDQKDYNKAMYYLNRSMALKRKTGNTRSIVSGLNGLAVLYMDLKDYPRALQNIDSMILLSEKFGLKDRLCEGLTNQGTIFRLQNRQNEAHACFVKARALAEELSNANFLAKINLETGHLYQDQARKDQARNSLLQGIKQARIANNPGFEQGAHHQLADLYYANGQFKEAFDEYRLFHEQYDTVAGATVKMQLYDMEAKYENQKKETEIALLKKDQLLQAVRIQEQNVFQTAILVTLTLVVVIGALLFGWYRANSRAKRQLEIERMRNHIAQDLHDDIGSTLSSINIISKMAAQHPEHDNVRNHFIQIEDHSGKMLSTMADIIWSISPENDSLSEVVLHMKEFAAEILEPKNINYRFDEKGDMDHVKIDAGLRKNVFLIFKEALNNAMKYSNCTGVSIGLTLASGSLTLDIADNGRGFDFQKIKPGNGLNNMKERASQMQAKLEVNSVEGQGTQIVLSVAVA